MLMQKIRRLFQRGDIPRDARELVDASQTPRQLLRGFDELITRNELEVSSVNREIEALEDVESAEVARIQSGELATRSKNSVLRRIQRLRKQMDNLEERQRIYNRNISLQIHLAGRIQALDAMAMRGVAEEAIDSIIATYEDELLSYQNAVDSEELVFTELDSSIDDRDELAQLERDLCGDGNASITPEPVEPAKRDRVQVTARRIASKADVVTAPSTDRAEAIDAERVERDGAVRSPHDRVGTRSSSVSSVPVTETAPRDALTGVEAE